MQDQVFEDVYVEKAYSVSDARIVGDKIFRQRDGWIYEYHGEWMKVLRMQERCDGYFSISDEYFSTNERQISLHSSKGVRVFDLSVEDSPPVNFCVRVESTKEEDVFVLSYFNRDYYVISFLNGEKRAKKLDVGREIMLYGVVYPLHVLDQYLGVWKGGAVIKRGDNIYHKDKVYHFLSDVGRYYEGRVILFRWDVGGIEDILYFDLETEKVYLLRGIEEDFDEVRIEGGRLIVRYGRRLDIYKF